MVACSPGKIDADLDRSLLYLSHDDESDGVWLPGLFCDDQRLVDEAIAIEIPLDCFRILAQTVRIIPDSCGTNRRILQLAPAPPSARRRQTDRVLCPYCRSRSSATIGAWKTRLHFDYRG
jgi:hypothetical protein